MYPCYYKTAMFKSRLYCPDRYPSLRPQDFGLSRYILPADGINGRVAVAADVIPVALNSKQGSFTWESDRLLGEGVGCDDASITGGVGTYLYASPEQMSGKG